MVWRKEEKEEVEEKLKLQEQRHRRARCKRRKTARECHVAFLTFTYPLKGKFLYRAWSF
jgi:hypothetical protein